MRWMACGHHGLAGPAVQEAAMVGNVTVPVIVQTRNLKIMDYIASDQMKRIVSATFKDVAMVSE